MKVGTPGDASVNRLVGEMFAEAAGIKLVMVPSRKCRRHSGVLGGHVQAGLVNAPDAKRTQRKDGYSALAVFASSVSQAFPMFLPH